MNNTNKEAKDSRFHYEIYTGPTDEPSDRPIAIEYVENHNAQCGYAELALDFKISADILIREYEISDLGNYTAPVSHLVRQTLELKLKALLQTTQKKGNTSGQRLLYSHDLKGIWEAGRDWLINHNYKILEDARVETSEWFITSFHEIDPSGDLFRFGISKQAAFGKQKSYDRVGLNLLVLKKDFEDTYTFLSHWEAVPFRETLYAEGEKDPYFNPNDFPRKS